MGKTSIFLLFCCFIASNTVSAITIDEVLEGNVGEDEAVGKAFVGAVKQTAEMPFLVTLFLSSDETTENINDFAFGTIIGKNEILTSMKFYFKDYVHLYIIYNGTEMRKLDNEFELLYSEKYDKDNGLYDALVIRLPNVEFEEKRIIQLKGDAEISYKEEGATLSLLDGVPTGLKVEYYPLDAFVQGGIDLNIDSEQQMAASNYNNPPFIGTQFAIFGSPWVIKGPQGKTFLLGFTSFYSEESPAFNIFQRVDFLCGKDFVNYEFSCQDFDEVEVESLTKISDENFEEVFEENAAVVALFREAKAILNWQKTFMGFGTVFAVNKILISAATIQDMIDHEEKETRYFISNKNNKYLHIDDLEYEMHGSKDVSSWHSIGYISSPSMSFTEEEVASLNKSPEILQRGFLTIEYVSEDEIAWIDYDLYSDKTCSQAFSDIHCCEWGPEHQVCGRAPSKPIGSAPLFDEETLVGVFATNNPFYHGQNVSVFTRIDANIDWIQNHL